MAVSSHLSSVGFSLPRLSLPKTSPLTPLAKKGEQLKKGLSQKLTQLDSYVAQRADSLRSVVSGSSAKAKEKISLLAEKGREKAHQKLLLAEWGNVVKPGSTTKESFFAAIDFFEKHGHEILTAGDSFWKATAKFGMSPEPQPLMQSCSDLMSGYLSLGILKRCEAAGQITPQDRSDVKALLERTRNATLSEKDSHNIDDLKTTKDLSTLFYKEYFEPEGDSGDWLAAISSSTLQPVGSTKINLKDGVLVNDLNEVITEKTVDFKNLSEAFYRGTNYHWSNFSSYFPQILPKLPGA